MSIAVRNEGSKVSSEINVTPMVDVMLVLLIIFMVITPMLSKGHDVDMAKVDNPMPMQDADKDDALLLAVDRSGKIYFGNTEIPLDKITDKIKEGLAAKTDSKMVFVKADARAKYKFVVDVVDNVRAAGVDQLGLLTEQRKSKVPAPPAGQ
jgi:biopolymer transport protein TolR